MANLRDLNAAGQSVWYDYIRRAFLESGELQALVDEGVTGITSNPSIFEKAIAGSADYDDDLPSLVAEGLSPMAIYESLAIVDIQSAADILRPVYDETGGDDGYVSLEVSPDLAHETGQTISEARRLWSAVDRPNLMIKVPATPAGIPAIQQLISEGINVNVTLMFSLDHYNAVAEAYISGLEKLAENGGDVSQVASVASFFISRVESAVDKALSTIGNTTLQGKIAVANGKIAYAQFQETFSSDRWQALAEKGARPQRVLWASTSTKNPAYPDTLYVDALIGPQTVNTVPPKTLNAFRDHGTVAQTLTADVDTARQHLADLAKLGIDLNAITEELQAVGVEKFAKSFDSLMDSVTAKRNKIQTDWTCLSTILGEHQAVVDSALQEMKADNIMHRIWQHDHTVWKDDPTEITNRLGWLHAPTNFANHVDDINEFVAGVKADGLTDVLLLGMGGSSLAPEVFANVFGGEGLNLAILDSTDAGAVLAQAERLDPAKTLFIVATKSGGTVETLSFFKYFYNWTADALGSEAVGSHFVAITDPGSKLEKLAKQYDFRHTFVNDPNMGGRYSVLSYFGLVPAGLVGVDVALLLDRAFSMACNGEGCNCPVDGDNNGARLGAIMGELAKAGRDKITFVASPELANFGDWVEQLVAESTGKEGVGILPIVGEPLGDPSVYGNDRLFVYLQLAGDDSYSAALAELSMAGHPVARLHLQDLYDLGEQFFLWELATAVAGYRLSIQPFDQPNVESAKISARKMVSAYHETGRIPESESAELSGDVLGAFVGGGRPGDYIAIHAYLQSTEETTEALQTLRLRLRDQTKLATTLGYGPRFLHSTGQLHKGDSNNGLFIQFTSDPVQDAAIPDEAGQADSAMSFGVLKMAQALGDGQALRDAGRRMIRFHISGDVIEELERLR